MGRFIVNVIKIRKDYYDMDKESREQSSVPSQVTASYEYMMLLLTDAANKRWFNLLLFIFIIPDYGFCILSLHVMFYFSVFNGFKYDGKIIIGRI